MSTALALVRHPRIPSPGPLVWRTLTSVRGAILIVLVLASAALIGVVVPQVPPGILSDPPLLDAWLADRREIFGPLTRPMFEAGTFDLFHSWWFRGILVYLSVAITACTYHRLPALWKQAFHLQRRIPDALFARASTEAILVADTDWLEAAMRRRHFRVQRWEDGAAGDDGATYLFADRFGWTVLATLITHLALILFLVAALVSRLSGFDGTLTIGEGTSAAVFPVGSEDQIHVQVDRAVGTFGRTAGRWTIARTWCSTRTAWKPSAARSP